MMNNVYKNVQVAIRKQIVKYISLLDCGIQSNQVVAENINRSLPKYPFITIDIVDDDNPVGLRADSDVFNMDIQLKAVTEDENKAKSIGRWLRKLLFLKQPFHDLVKQGIAPQTARSIPNTVSPITNDMQFQSGGIITLQVLDPIIDETQTGMLDKVNAEYKKKG